MDLKNSPAIDSKRDGAPKGDQGWILAIPSSKRVFALILLLAAITWYGFYCTHTKGVLGSDDRGYCEVARNIANGKGIVRNFVFPVEINFFEKLPVPDFFHPPGYPLILSGFFKLFGVSDFVALLPSYLSYFILIIFFFFLIKDSTEIKTATVATLMLIFNKTILDMSLVPLSEALYTLIFFLFFILMVRAKTSKDIFVASLILGGSHLIRENVYPYFIAVFIYLYLSTDLPRRKKMIFLVAGILIPIVPKVVRTYLETGSPFFSYGKFALIAFTGKYPWMDVWRDIQNPSLFGFLIGEPSQFILKYLDNAVGILEGVLTVSNPYLLSFCLMEMLHQDAHAQWKKAKMLFIALFVSQIFFISLINYDRRYFFPFLPMVVLFGSKSFLRISGVLASSVKIRWKNTIATLMVLFFFVFFMMPSIYLILRRSGPPMLDFKTPQYAFLFPSGEANKLNDFLRGELKENQVVWTDLPEILEWEGDRLCGWLPTKIEHIYEIHKKFPVDAILLTNIRTPSRMGEQWSYLLFSEQSLPRYRNVKWYRGKAIVAKLLIRDEKD